MSDLFRPLGSVVSDDTANWIDPNGRTLSDRIWMAGQTTRDQIDHVLTQGVLAGDSPVTIARLLEQFLSPSWAAKRDDNGRLIQNQPRQIVTDTPYSLGAGSYPARRVARTEVTRAFGKATIESARRNSAVEKVAWRLSGSHPHADQCDANARGGPYLVDDVPSYPAHPHCKCVLVPIAKESTAELVDRIRRERRP